MDASPELPLAGIKVVEFTHMVMGPTVGVVLADLGAEVVKVEPIDGDATRNLLGSGAGYFPMYNRNKSSVRLNLKSADGVEAARRLSGWADIVVENFRPGAMDKLGLGYEALALENPGLIYCSQKGFLPGPYEHRTALDEVAQMMGGLAYMTGPPGQPLRAGASVIDVAGGMFGVIGVLAALEQRRRTGQGQCVKSSLFETTVFLMGQHMAQKAVTGEAARPMPVRISAWAIYDVFETRDGEHLFVGVVSDALWRKFCDLFGLAELGADPGLAANAQRVLARENLMPKIRELLKGFDKADLIAKLERSGLPFAPIGKPEDMFDDPQMRAGGLVPVQMADGAVSYLPALPLEMDGRRLNRAEPPPSPGQHTRQALTAVGYSDEAIEALLAAGVAA